MQLVILAGGKGTRLGFDGIPKPMVPVGDQPNLIHQLNLAKEYGVTEVFLLTGHLSEVIFKEIGNGEKWGLKITHIIEPFPLGTAGSLKLLEYVLEDRFLVFYGDVVMDMDIQAFIDFDAANNSCATLLAHPNDHPYDSDLVETDERNRITAFLSKPHKEGLVYRNLVNAAVYILSKKVFNYINFGIAQDFGKDIFPRMLKAGENLACYRNMEYIKDMGTKERLPKVINDWNSGKVARLNKRFTRPAVFLDRDGVINEFVDNLNKVEDFKLFPFSAKAVKILNESDYLPIVITNQPMIAKGFLSFEELELIHKKMETELGLSHAYLAGIYYCPHHPDKGYAGEIAELKKECDCRKPEIGMLKKAVMEFNIDLSRSWFIGDSTIDVKTGKNAGLKTVLVKTGVSGKDQKYKVEPDFIAADLLEAVEKILEFSKK